MLDGILERLEDRSTLKGDVNRAAARTEDNCTIEAFLSYKSEKCLTEML